MARFLVPALVAFATLSSPATVNVDAASTGRLGYCSLAPTYKYGKGSAVMNWVNAPVFADFYTVRSADTIQPITSIPASDPTTYKPGQWTPIHLRVHNLDKKYIGLVIYATNGATDATTGLTNRAGTQVGEWKVTDNLAFWSPDTCGGTALTHSDADIKPLHSVLYWRAPAGTGKVSFHVMIKQGEQGQGNFYYPKFTLSLNEAAATPTPATIMIEAAPKQSCTAACAATPAHKTCDETATAGLSSAAALSTALTGAARSQLICRPQIVSGCISAAPMRQPADLCSFKSTTCAAQDRATAPTTCSATSMRDDLTRFCMCTQTAAATTKPPVVTTAPTTAATAKPTTAATATPTTAATAKPTTAATSAPTTAATVKPTTAATAKPTTAATAAPTTKATTAPTTAATAAPTTKATTAPTSATTTKPTDKATATPTTAATSKPTDKTTNKPETTTSPTSTATDAPGTTTDAPSTTDAPAATSAPTGTGLDGATEPPAATEAPTQTPIGLGSSTGLNAASSRSAQSTIHILLAMCASLFLSGSRRASLLIALLACLYALPAAHAHNYVTSPSRALVASVLKPCQARVSPFPHIQVTPAQKFPMEWVVGHGDSRTKNFYWMLVKAEDFEQLNMITDAILEEYIAGAPTTAKWYNSTEWKKRHVGVASENLSMDADYMSKYFSGVATTADANYIVRDDIYREKSIFNPKDATKLTQWTFNQASLAKDARVSYKNAKYPFLISVHRFWNTFAEHNPYAHQPNIAQFEIPTGSAPGEYIYHFKWGGYRDCVDVNVRAATAAMPTIPLPFGKSAAQALADAGGIAPFVKQDHCEWLFVHNPVTTCRIVPRSNTGALNVSQCVRDCQANNGCRGVQLVRATNPAEVRIPYPVSIPYHMWNNTGLDANGNPLRVQYPCEFHMISERESRDCALKYPQFINNDPKRPNPLYQCNEDVLKPQLKDDDYVCYGLSPYRNQDFQAAEDFMTVDDPADPKFYSTCWARIEPGGFIDTPRPPPITPLWAVGDKCMDCEFRANVPKLSLTDAPKWTDALTTQCRNCDEPTL